MKPEFPVAPAEVKITPGVGATEYKITGPLESVFEAIRAVFDQYHPHGYGTMVHQISTESYSGNYVARMSRANSCD